MFLDEPKIKFKFNQKVYVYITQGVIDYLPCTPLDGHKTNISGIPNKTWIIYKGLIRCYGQYFMRFEYMDEFVYLGLGTLEYLENIGQNRAYRKSSNVNKTVSTVPRKNKVNFKQMKTNHSSVLKKR